MLAADDGPISSATTAARPRSSLRRASPASFQHGRSCRPSAILEPFLPRTRDLYRMSRIIQPGTCSDQRVSAGVQGHLDSFVTSPSRTTAPRYRLFNQPRTGHRYQNVTVEKSSDGWLRTCGHDHQGIGLAEPLPSRPVREGRKARGTAADHRAVLDLLRSHVQLAGRLTRALCSHLAM